MKFRFRSMLLRSTPRRALFLCAVALLQSLAMPLCAQTTGEFAAVLRGKGAPQTIKAGDLTKDWQRFVRVNPQSELTVLMAREIEIPPAIYYTRGETVSAGGETFLITYHAAPPTPGRDADDKDGNGVRDDMQEKAGAMRLKSSDVLSLSLLNVRTIGDMNEVRAVDPAKDVMNEADVVRAKILGANMESVSNLKQIGLGLMQYVQDYDEKFPPMRSVQSAKEIMNPRAGALPTVQQVLQPYIKSVQVFSHPVTHELYQPNIAVSGMNVASLNEPARTVGFWEKTPASDGRRAVLYLDGHVTREPESDWPRILAASNKLLPLRNPMPRKRQNELRHLDGAATVTPRVKTYLGANRALQGTMINVSTTQHVVTLDGSTKSESQKQLAGAIAKKYAPGFVVINNLQVQKRQSKAMGKRGETRMIDGMRVMDLRVGTGKQAKAGKNLTVDYRGMLQNGKVFDESYKRGQPFQFTLGAGQVIQGWDKGFAGMKEGGKRRLTIPGNMAYGANSPSADIPANATLIFDVELRKVG